MKRTTNDTLNKFETQSIDSKVTTLIIRRHTSDDESVSDMEVNRLESENGYEFDEVLERND